MQQPHVLPVFTQPSANQHRYQVIQRLGGGAMGAVFLAQDEQQRRVAIKLPATSGRWRAEYVQRIWKEIRILSKLQHPNVIEIHDWGQEEQLGPYIVMEYIEGGSVLQLMMQHQPPRLDPNEALRITVAVADALTYAHALRPPIIHRDIKPDNILIRRSDGRVKVTDFGLAAIMERGRAMTQWGTPDYIAPEQALGKGADGRSDLYALAATLYHMLTGLRPPSLGMPLPARPSANMLPGIMQPDQARRLDYLIITLLAYDPNNRRPAPNRKSWKAVDVAEEARAIAERRPARLYPGPEDSLIFPGLMTGMVPPAGAPQPRPPQAPPPQVPPQAPLPVPQAMPPLQAPPPQVPPFQAPQAPPLMAAPPPLRPAAPPPPAPQPGQPLQAEQVILFHPPSPAPLPQTPAAPPRAPSGGIPVPPPVQVPLPPPARAPSGVIPASPPQPQARAPSGGIPVPPQPAAGSQAAPPPMMQAPTVPANPQPFPAPPPAVQVRPAPQIPPPAPGGPAASPPAVARKPGLSAGEKEVVIGLLVGILGVVALAAADLNSLTSADLWFVGLARGLILWGAGLLLGLASPRGRRGAFPWLALLTTVLTLAAGFPLAQLVVESQKFGGVLSVFAGLHSLLLWLLLSLPFALLGAAATWLAIKVLGKDETQAHP